MSQGPEFFETQCSTGSMFGIKMLDHTLALLLIYFPLLYMVSEFGILLGIVILI